MDITLSELVFLISFLYMISVTFIKLYNIMTSILSTEKSNNSLEDLSGNNVYHNNGTFLSKHFPYTIKGSLLFFVSTLLAWGINFTIMILEYDNIAIVQLSKLLTWLLGLHVMFLFIEIFISYIHIVKFATGKLDFRKRIIDRNKNMRFRHRFDPDIVGPPHIKNIGDVIDVPGFKTRY